MIDYSANQGQFLSIHPEATFGLKEMNKDVQKRESPALNVIL
jgi:hypothetical protein